MVDEKDADKLSFDMFNIDKVLNGSKTLLGSSGDEYKISINLEGNFGYKSIEVFGSIDRTLL